MKYKILTLIAITAFVAGCSGMQWYRGGVIQYNDLNQSDDGSYSVEVLGHYSHTETDLIDAVKEKGSTVCAGKTPKINEHQMGSYYSHTQFGSFEAPKITANFSCI